MDEDVVIKGENVSKKYCKSLKRSMLYGITDSGKNLLGLSSHSERLRRHEFWAVDNASFELKKGEALGLIGPNGSGKSTILKMLNGIFWPDKGKITVKGRVGALIEVGAGFHPLLTGRENIFINGAILGMTKQEVDEKFDDIVDFADIGDFIDSPVRSYSSGMFVRLGFSIAVHCEPDILLLDEVLAVGDAAFRNKCFRRMKEIRSAKNASIVFVSHDLYTVERFCDKGLFLNHGRIKSYGEVHDIISDYEHFTNQSFTSNFSFSNETSLPYSTKEIEITCVDFLNRDGKKQEAFNFNEMLIIRIEYEAKEAVTNPRFEVEISTSTGQMVSVLGPHIDNFEIPSIKQGKGIIECRIEKLFLLANKYFVNVGIYDNTRTIFFDWWQSTTHPELYFLIFPNRVSTLMGQYTGICHFDSNWVINGQELGLPQREKQL